MLFIRSFLIVLLATAVVGALVWSIGGKSPIDRASENPGGAQEDLGNAAPSGETGRGNSQDFDERRGQEEAGENVRGERSCEVKGKRARLRIGGFERPENPPKYEILENERNFRDCARGAYLLVDTRAHDEAGFELIARDIKARYAGLDAVSVEFTDATGVLDYEGAALIFNTPAGVDYIGFVYGPPNNEGYFVRAAD